MNDMQACETPMADHVRRFWEMLATETVHLTVNLRREIGHDAPNGTTVYYDSSTFSDDVAKALVADRIGDPAQSKQEHVDWAASRWTSEVANRPLQNVHRRSLDTTWRQVIRHFGGDDAALCGPTHDDLITEAPGYAGPDRNMPLEGYSVSSTGGGTAA